jgi:hypothetical protein
MNLGIVTRLILVVIDPNIRNEIVLFRLQKRVDNGLEKHGSGASFADDTRYKENAIGVSTGASI